MWLTEGSMGEQKGGVKNLRGGQVTFPTQTEAGTPSGDGVEPVGSDNTTSPLEEAGHLTGSVI